MPAPCSSQARSWFANDRTGSTTSRFREPSVRWQTGEEREGETSVGSVASAGDWGAVGRHQERGQPALTHLFHAGNGP